MNKNEIAVLQVITDLEIANQILHISDLFLHFIHFISYDIIDIQYTVYMSTSVSSLNQSQAWSPGFRRFVMDAQHHSTDNGTAVAVFSGIT